MKPYTLCL